MGMMADALCGTHTLKSRVSIGGESVDCVLEGLPTEKDYLFEVKYYIDELDLDPVREAILGLGIAVANASTVGREAVGLMLIVVGNWSEDEIDPVDERERIRHVVQHASAMRQNVSADVRITVITEDGLKSMAPEELSLRLIANPHVVTRIARLTS